MNLNKICLLWRLQVNVNFQYVFNFTFVFFLRILPALFSPVDFDSYYFLFMKNYIREKGIKNLKLEEKTILTADFNRPWFVEWLISFFPKKYDKFIAKIFNPLLDSLFILIIYFITLYLTNSIHLSILAVCIYFFTPATFSILGTGPRIKSFTPRLFGEVIGSLVFIFQYLYFVKQKYLFLFLSCFFSGIVFLSSKFSAQAIVFISIFVAILSKKFEFLIAPGGGILIAILLSKGNYIHILKNQIDHLYMYFVRNLKGQMHVSKRNNIKVMWNILKRKNFIDIAKHFLLDNTFFILLYKYPVVVVSLIYIINSKTFSYLDILVLSGIIVFFITSLKWFLFIGEAERYINHVLYFSILLVIQRSHSPFTNILIIYGIIYYILDIIYAWLARNNKFNKKNETFIEWLKSFSEKLRIATIPYHLGGWRILYETPHNWLYDIPWYDKKEKDYIMKNFYLRYPFLDVSKADRIIERYNLDYVFVDIESVRKTFGQCEIPKGLKVQHITEDIIALSKDR